MSKKVVLVTGCNRGIGYYIARNVLSLGHSLIIACRSASVGEEAAAALQAEVQLGTTGAKILGVVTLSLEDPATIADFPRQVSKVLAPNQRLDAVVHNAGFAFGYEAPEPLSLQARKTTAINFYGTVAVNESLIDLISDGGRIVILGSRYGYLSTIPSKEIRDRIADPALTVAGLSALVDDFVATAQHDDRKFPETVWPKSAYQVSKVAINAYAHIFAHDPRLVSRGITLNAACPGWCKTNLTGGSGNRTAEEGADTPSWLAVADESTGLTGKFFGERKEVNFYTGVW